MDNAVRQADEELIIPTEQGLTLANIHRDAAVVISRATARRAVNSVLGRDDAVVKCTAEIDEALQLIKAVEAVLKTSNVDTHTAYRAALEARQRDDFNQLHALRERNSNEPTDDRN